MIEVYANGRACISDRIYPTREDSIGVGAFARGRGAAPAAVHGRVADAADLE